MCRCRCRYSRDVKQQAAIPQCVPQTKLGLPLAKLGEIPPLLELWKVGLHSDSVALSRRATLPASLSGAFLSYTILSELVTSLNGHFTFSSAKQSTDAQCQRSLLLLSLCFSSTRKP